ncbi:hypothetical protein AB0A63_39730, partial [Lentzea sp. NPDC042327]|uniref:hypothetical protein n=1 Tax=Lentzea sp. NPDC042327 TaxID=3154801 RepID=UPI0033C3392F
MTTTAAALLTAIDPLPAPARQRHIATTALSLAGTAELDAVLRDLAGRGTFERRLAVQLAAIAGHREHVRRELAAPQTAVQWTALRAAVRLGLPAEVFLERLPEMAAATRRRLYRLVRREQATALADALLPVVWERHGDDEAAALLVACSAPPLRELEHAAANWSAIGKRHPAALLDLVEAELAAAPVSAWKQIWSHREVAVRSAAEKLPMRVLDLVERVAPHVWSVRLPSVLARVAPERVAGLLAQDSAHQPASGRFWRRLAGVDERALVAVARRLHPSGLRHLLHALPPSRRASVYEGAVGERPDVPFAVLDELPVADRAVQARRLLGLRRVADSPSQRLAVTARLPWEEAREPLLAATKRATADERAEAYPLYVQAAAASKDPDAFAAMLATLTRLPNEQDPVRAPALMALAKVPAWLFRASEAPLLAKLLLDATRARDSSWSTWHAVQELATALVRQGAVTSEPVLVETGLDGLNLVGEHNSHVHLPGLHRSLPRGAEHQVFAALRPRMTADAGRDQYSLVLALAAGLERRAWHLPELQDLVGRARFAAQETVACQAIVLWLAPTATRDDRVGQVLSDDISSIVLGEVQRAVSMRRTDLLDLVVGRRVRGRFWNSDVAFVPHYTRCFHLWMPRQIAEHAAQLASIARSTGHAVLARVNATTALGQVPGTAATLRTLLRDNEVRVAEAALSALAWTDEPADVLPDLLALADTDRARVAVYAATRCARFTPPTRLRALLAPVLRGKKVTSRKEAVRLLAEHQVPGTLPELAAIWPDTHRDIKRAIVSACRYFLDDEAAWDLLSAAAEGEAPVALSVLDLPPQDVADRHRTRYASLVRAIAVRPEPEAARRALATLPLWSRWDTGGTDLLADLTTDLTRTATWQQALTALVAACEDDLTPLRTAVTRLLSTLDTHNAEPDRDLPARQRIRAVVRLLADDRTSPTHRAFERLLAHDLATPMPREAIRLAASAVDWQADDVLDQVLFTASLATRPTLALDARTELQRWLRHNAAKTTPAQLRTLATALLAPAPLVALGFADVAGET